MRPLTLHNLLLSPALAAFALAATVAAPASPCAAAQDEQQSAPAEPPAAPSAASVAESTNAASVYRRAFVKLQEIKSRIPDDQWDALDDFESDPSRGPSLQVRDTLKKLMPVIALTRQAARREQLHFDIDYAAADDVTSHFSGLRNLTRPLRYDYLVHLADGDTRGVVDELTTMYRMAAQAPQEHVLMGSLIGSALFAFADSRLTMALDHAMIGPNEAAALLKELSRFKGDDPMGVREALAGEQRLIADQMSKRFSGDEGLERFKAEYHDRFGDQADTAWMEALTPEHVSALLARASDAAGAMAQAFAEPDENRSGLDMARLENQIDKDLGPLALQFPALDGSRLRDIMRQTRKQLEDRTRTLSDIADGRLDPMALANAAVWYVRATLQWEQIDPDKRRQIDAYLARHNAPADANLTAIFNRHDVQRVIDTLATATSLRRCDWSYASGGWPYTFRPYHAGLLGGGRLLVADAARLIHEQRDDDAARRLAIAYRMSGHIAGDGVIAGSLTAHRIFNDADALVADAIDSHIFDTRQVSLLHDQVKALSRADPFHYQPAISALRSNLTYPIEYMVQGLPKDAPRPTQQQQQRAEQILDGLDADRVLSIDIVYDHWEPWFYRRRPDRDLGAAATGLETIFDVQALRQARDLAPALTEWSKQGVIEQVRTADLPKIAPIEQRAQASLGDYHQCVARLERALPRAN